MAEVNLSDIVRHIIMSTECDDVQQNNLKRLSFIIEQQSEQKTLTPSQLTTVMRVISLRHTYTKTSNKLTNSNTNALSVSDISYTHLLVKKQHQSYCSGVQSVSYALLSCLTPRAGPLA
ncbi:MAG: hypothetical protein MJZ13_02605 [Bacteroidales bacterium]|nr:hypothetical protein [Bacteroidales bacterium]